MTINGFWVLSSDKHRQDPPNDIILDEVACVCINDFDTDMDPSLHTLA